jgi:hypothetical protein
MAFRGSDYIAQVAKRLTQEFAFSSGAGTPGLVGSAKEHPARVQLGNLLSEGVSVGSGIVIDSFGNQSRQQDIVIFEKIAPIFSVNGSPDATFYPVEGVIAVGEVKSALGKAELRDAFEKSASTKRLRRHAVSEDNGFGVPTVSFRNYTSVVSFSGAESEQFDQDRKSLHQVFTFVLCEKFAASPEAMLSSYISFVREFEAQNAPNLVTSLQDGLLCPHKSTTNSITRAAFEADGAIFSEGGAMAFEKLIWLVRVYVNSGKTVNRSAYERYFASGAGGIPISSRGTF